MSDADSQSSLPDSLESAADRAARDAAALATELGNQVGAEHPNRSPPPSDEEPSKASVSDDTQVPDGTAGTDVVAEDASTAAPEENASDPSPPKSVIQLPDRSTRKSARGAESADPPGQNPTLESESMPSADATPHDIPIPEGDDLADATRYLGSETDDVELHLQSQSAGRTAKSDPAAEQRTMRNSGSVDDGFGRISMVAVDTLCHVLDLIDRPFGRVGYRARCVLGWLSLLLLVASISLVLAMAMI